jgi:hypothetical protein
MTVTATSRFGGYAFLTTENINGISLMNNLHYDEKTTLVQLLSLLR